VKPANNQYQYMNPQTLENTPGEQQTYPKTYGGLTINRHFTKMGESPLDSIEYEARSCSIKSPQGEIIFEMKNCEIPKTWSQVASDIMISKYFRKAGVPQHDNQGNPILDQNGQQVLGAEQSAKQVINRLAGCWRHWGERYGYFQSEIDAENFQAELEYMLINQLAAPNSPQWFNTGLHWKYGINGPSQGHFYVDPDTHTLVESKDAYTHPQPHACFIQSVTDDLVNKGGIMDLWTREARLFKYGSGTGTNYSDIRGDGEPLSGGGYSSGLMSFLKIGDSAAGAIKSGGTTRRAAKMVCLNIDHPDVEAFIDWKKDEEKKVAALIAAGYDSDFNGEAYRTVSGQNSNNSIRVTHEFMEAIRLDKDWHLRWRKDNSICKTLKARDLWNKIAEAAWVCADPGIQFDSTINEWHTCPASGRINASNPCSEYMFLDDTACNLASINLIHFYNQKDNTIDLKSFEHAIRLWTIVLEISVLMAQYPSEQIAELSYRFRTLGLGYANLGTILMLSGIPYDSEEARAITGAITAVMTGYSYATSAEMAEALGTFPGYPENAEHMLRVIRNHRKAAYFAAPSEYENLTIAPLGINPQYCPEYLLAESKKAWDKALDLGQRHGYRNAQTTVIAPTGTIGLLMDCDTTGVEPDFALVKFKKLAGGGHFKIINQSIEPALKNLGYDEQERKDILTYILGTLSLEVSPHINRKSLKEKGLSDEAINKIEKQLPKSFYMKEAFKTWIIGEENLKSLGLTSEQLNDPAFDLLAKLGFNDEQIREANFVICGHMTVEGAPHLKDKHLPVFDCANKCGELGTRFIHHMGHVKMMASAQSFISGAISKTINMPNEVSVEDIKECYDESWKLSVKAMAIYRDGCKLSQALNTKSDSQKETPKEKDTELLAAEELLREFENKLFRGQKRRLPVKRQGITVESKIGGQKIHLRTGEYEDGSLGEIFIDMFKEGASYRSLLNSLAVAISVGLQYGVPLESFVEKFTFTRFEPAGFTDHPNVKNATSILDFIFRVLGMEYLGREDFVHVKPTETRKEQTEIYEKIKGLSTKKEAEAQETAKAETKTLDKIAAAMQAEQKNLLKSQADESLKSQTDLNETNASAAENHLKSMMGDAPACSVCGHITVRNAACYKCLNCGNSEGCS
jgi:ribonucleoside-diphosphate reductase alpha chain